MSLFWKGETFLLWWTGWGFVCKETAQVSGGPCAGDYFLLTSGHVSLLVTKAQFSTRLKVQFMHRGWATCSRAQTLPPETSCFVSFIVSMLSSGGAWLTFSVIISDSFVQKKMMILILHVSGTVLKMFGFGILVSVFWTSPFLQFLVSISLITAEFNCCYLSVLCSMKEQCLRALVVLWGWWVLCLSKQILQ